MKKIYILASAVVLASLSFGQKTPLSKRDSAPTSEFSNRTNSEQANIKKSAPGNVFWYEDFENGLAGNAVDGSNNPIGGTLTWLTGYAGTTDYSALWVHDFSGPQGQYEAGLPFNSESAADGWMLIDANLQTDIENNGDFITMDAYLESPEIDISSTASNAAVLDIQHTYRSCCANNAYPIDILVGYFDTGIGDWQWTQVNSGNKSHNEYPASRTSSVYEPERRVMSIACVAELAKGGTGNGKIKIRFHWNSDLNASSSYYFWMIDDVRIAEGYSVDSWLVDMYTGDIVNDFEYYAIPEGQIANYPLIIGGDLYNMGGTQLTGVNLNYTVTPPTSSDETGNSSTITLNVCEENTIWFDTGFVPAASEYGEYLVEITSDHNETDEKTSDNTLSKIWAMTEFEFGHYNPNGDVGVDIVNASTTNSNPGRVMSAYAIYEDAVIYGITILLEDGSTTVNDIGQIAAVGLYDAADGVTQLAYAEFEVTSDMIGVPTTILLDTPYEVFAGDVFYASLNAFGGGDNLLVAKDFDGDQDNSALVDINGTIYGDSGDHYVNLSFKVVVSTKENIVNLSSATAIPNPAAYSTEVRYSVATNANVTLEVTDVTGKIVMTENLGSKVAGNHTYEMNTANLADGIYYYTLVAGQDRLTNKLVVRK